MHVVRLGVLILLLFGGCARRYDVWGFVVNDKGEPIPGALLYVEAYTGGGGAYDFVWGRADSSGRVANGNGEPLSLSRRPGARLAVAVFAPGKSTLVIYDELGRINVRGTKFTLEDSSGTRMSWEPRLAKLGFPFKDKKDLYRRLQQPPNRGLVAVFAAAYAPIRSGAVSALPAEWEKAEAIENLLKRN